MRSIPQTPMRVASFLVLGSLAASLAVAADTPPATSPTAQEQAGPTQGDLQKQIDELRKIIERQQKEIDELKGAKGSKPVTQKQGEAIDIYGFIRFDAMRDSSLADDVQKPIFIRSPDSTGGANHEQFSMHPRLTRIGLNYTSPTPAFADWKLTGQAEFDFQGGGSESRPTPRGRQLWLKVTRGFNSVLFGQTWDLISPLQPSPNDDTLLWGVGNLGDRRPQVRYTFDNKTVNAAVAIGLTGAIDAKDLDANGVRDGEQSGMPHLQARLGWTGKTGSSAGVWGVTGSEKTTAAVGGRKNFTTQGVGADLLWKFNPQIDVRGEGWTGRNLSDFRGGIGQGVNATTGHEIMSSGFWSELGFQPEKRYRVSFGYGLDDPRDADVAANGRVRNFAWYVANKWFLGPVEMGLNYLYWTTEYKGLRRGIDNRLNFYIIHRF